MTISKKAVDATARDYWITYFGDYGKIWVRDIDRKITAALSQKLPRTAAVEMKSGPAKIVPLGKVITRERVLLEGAIRTAKRDRLFSAEFNHQGKLLGFDAA
tara:strand:- start:3512 stop:3817 length:306 start_codon:yes stop_codon:yes gene_type:complete